MNAPNALGRAARGFTLTELLITMAILGLVMAAVLGVQMTSSTMFLRGENQAEAQQGARAAMLMEEDLRMVGYGCPDLGCPTPPPGGAQQKITAASVNAITFWADTLNVSTQLSAAVAAGATSLPVVNDGGIIVGDRIYLNKLADAPIAAPVAAADLPLIGRIQIQTTTLSAQAASGRSTYQINTNVRPRNL